LAKEDEQQPMPTPSKSSRIVAVRARNEEERRTKMQAILDAALDVFVEDGFSHARLDEVAQRAGIAKGTLYLYFESKQALFEALIRSGIARPVDAMKERIFAAEGSTETLLRMMFAFFAHDVLGTRRRDILRLIITEAHRFPEIAALYHREVVGKGIATLRYIAKRAAERGEFQGDEIERFPHLIVAPALVAVVWKSLFERFEPLDVEALFDAHLAILLRAMRTHRS
jgi:AcrR family transcriptional regulator